MAEINAYGFQTNLAVGNCFVTQPCTADPGDATANAQSYLAPLAYLNGMLANIQAARFPDFGMNPLAMFGGGLDPMMMMLGADPMSSMFGGGMDPMMLMMMIMMQRQQQQQMMMMMLCLLAGRQGQQQPVYDPGVNPGNGAVQPGSPANGPSCVGGAAGRALAAAQSELGVTGACNSNEVRKFSQGRSEAWCADFVSWAYEQGGRSPFGHRAGVSGISEWAQGQGNYHQRGDGYVPRPGDIVMFGDNQHVGLVKSVDADGTVHTIEGNSGRTAGRSADCGAVAEHAYRAGSGFITGYADMSRYS